MRSSQVMLETERTLVNPGVVSLYDKSRYGHVGVLTATTVTQLPSRLWVHAFNGTTSLITIPAAKPLSPYNKQATWSASAWINPTSDGEGDLGTIYSQATGWYLRVREEVAGVVKLSGWIDHLTTDANAISSTTMTLATWHRVAMVYNRLGTYKIELYIDGTLCTLGTDTAGVGAIIDGSASALILGNEVGVTNTFDGSISAWKIQARALRAADVLVMFNAEKNWFGV